MQTEMKLGDDSQRLAFRSLHDDGPTCTWDGNSAEKPLLAIRPLARSRGCLAMQCLISTRQLVQHCPQDLLVIGRGDEFTAIIDDADHKPMALVLLGIDDCPQGVAELRE